MELKHRFENSVYILELAGRFDAYEVPTVVKWFDERPQVKNVIINLKGVGFIDSSGLSTLVKALKRCRQNDGELYLSDLQQAVHIIFELTRLDKAFTIFADEATAIAAFQTQGK